MLGLTFALTLDLAHRSLRLQPKDGDPPRAIVVKLHYFQKREEFFRKATSITMVLQDQRISIFPDYTPEVVKKRAAFSEVKQLVRGCADVTCGLLYPATLRINTASGQEHQFTDPSTATDFIKKEVLKGGH